jgi:hypothetical protein
MATVADVQVGDRYRVRWHDGSFTTVEVVGFTNEPIRQYRAGAYRTVGRKRRFRVVNLSTGRYCVVKSASKFRDKVGGAA